MVLWFWVVIGLNVAWKKGTVDRTVNWIGTHIAVDSTQGKVIVENPASA